MPKTNAKLIPEFDDNIPFFFLPPEERHEAEVAAFARRIIDQLGPFARIDKLQLDYLEQQAATGGLNLDDIDTCKIISQNAYNGLNLLYLGLDPEMRTALEESLIADQDFMAAAQRRRRRANGKA